MFEPIARMEAGVLGTRWEKCRARLAETAPDAGGLLVFSRMHIYYFTGTLGQGVFWLPLKGEPVLMIRKGVARAELESNVENICPFKSFREIPSLTAEAGSPLTEVVAAETAGLNWQLGQLLTAKLPDVRFTPGDMAISLARAVKSEWELSVMRRCGELHNEGLHDILPYRLRPGLNERQISLIIWEVFFSLGHSGIMRMSSFGEEIFLGHVSAGDSGNYPSTFNGPLGLRGEHPAVPYMGHAGRVWRKHEPLSCDVGFSLDGYQTDKTQVFWSGPRELVPDQVASAHSFCMDVQAWLAENARAKALPSDLYRHCADWAAREGFAEGFMGLGENKVFFVGHGIGLTIDGYPVIAKGFDRPLEKGMVLALEPKMGLPGVGMVGVENTFEVTDKEAVCITGNDFSMVHIV